MPTETTRKARIDAVIASGDIQILLELAEGRACACMGAEGDEPDCRCVMTSRQIRNAVSLAALQRGKLVRLLGGETDGE